jgi:hypothetical protein
VENDWVLTNSTRCISLRWTYGKPERFFSLRRLSVRRYYKKNHPWKEIPHEVSRS